MLTKRFLHSAGPMDTSSRKVGHLPVLAHTVAEAGLGVRNVAACSYGVDRIDEACELYG